jgi:hypothetical protein
MNLRRLFSLAKEGWVNRPQTQPLGIRARDLRRMAVDLDKEVSAHGVPALPDQVAYVRLNEVANTSPREAVLEGWNEVSLLLRQLSAQRGIAFKGGTLGLLNTVERQKLLDFHAYALLRDMYAFKVDAAGPSSVDLSPEAAQDYAVAVRGAHRVLSRLLAYVPNVTP